MKITAIMTHFYSKKNKAFYIIMSMLLLLACSCSKSNTNSLANNGSQTNNNNPTVLLSSVYDNKAGDYNYGQRVMQFEYSGSKISKLLVYGLNNLFYSGGEVPDTLTFSFNYDNTGRLLTINETDPQQVNNNPSDPTDTTVAVFNFYYTGDNLTLIKKITDYNDGTSGLPYDEYDYSYTYDSNGQLASYNYQTNPISNENVTLLFSFQGDNLYTYTPTIINGFTQTNVIYSYFNYDTKNSISKSLSLTNYLFLYYCLDFVSEGIGTLGANNPTGVSYSGTNGTFTYEYNSDGYPSAVTAAYPFYYSYKFNYVHAN